MEKSHPRNSADDGTLYTADNYEIFWKKTLKISTLKHIFADINLKDLKIWKIMKIFLGQFQLISL